MCFASGVVLRCSLGCRSGKGCWKADSDPGWCHCVLSSIVGAFIRTGYSWLSPAGSTAKIIAEGNVVHISLSSLIPIQYLFRKIQ